MNKYFRNFLFGMALLLGSTLSFGQTAITATTLSSAITDASVQRVVVASATGITAGTTVIYVDREAMKVVAASSTTLTVVRGSLSTRSTTHASGAYVYLGPGGSSGPFVSNDYAGTCTAANEIILPKINVTNGKVFDCGASGKWYEIGGPGGNYREVILCGDMGNNTTVYDSPVTGYAAGNLYAAGTTANDLSYVLAGSGCSAEDSGTEATADEVMFANNDVYVVGLQCTVDSSGSNGVTFSMRDDAADLTPAYSLTIATTKTTASTDVKNIIKIAAGSTVALKVVSTEDLSTNDNWCVARIQVAP